jgi:hypothetical protein
MEADYRVVKLERELPEYVKELQRLMGLLG